MNLVAMTLLLIACMLLPSGLALGQSNLGTITGVVTDGVGSRLTFRVFTIPR